MTATTTMATIKLRGPELARAAINHILLHPEVWDQRTDDKGFAGVVCDLAGASDAKTLLGISDEDAEWAFHAARGLAQLHAFAVAMLADRRTSFDPLRFYKGGRDWPGFDRYNCDENGQRLELIA